MAKKTKLHFAPADWLGDLSVQALGYFEQGVWFNLLLRMHSSPVCGKLMLRADKAMDDATVANLLRLELQAWEAIKGKLLDYGVASICKDTGALVCRRMVRDEAHRQRYREYGCRGGNPALVKGVNPRDNGRVNPRVKGKVKGGVVRKEKGSLPPSPSPLSLIPKENLPPISPPRGHVQSTMNLSTKKRVRVEDNTELQVRIGKFFNRKPSTLWSLADAEALLQINPFDGAVAMLEAYYSATVPDVAKFRRKSLPTLLNNWDEELDKARRFLEKHRQPLMAQRNKLAKELQEATSYLEDTQEYDGPGTRQEHARGRVQRLGRERAVLDRQIAKLKITE